MSNKQDTLTRFSRDMDGSMEPDENGAWVRYEEVIALATHPAQAKHSDVVHVCPEKDIVCGDKPANWCATCPKRKAQAQQVARDREQDRARFPDPDFNRWLDESITENGEFTAWHTLSNTGDAYAGWTVRPYYATAQAQQVAWEVVAIHPSWLDYWSFKECDRLARIWTEGIDLTKSDDAHEGDLGPQWKVVMAIMLARIAATTPPAPVSQPAAQGVPESFVAHWRARADEHADSKDEAYQEYAAGINDVLNALLTASPTPPAQQGEPT